MDNKYNKSESIMLEGRLAEFVEALQDEQYAIEKNGQSSILLHSGQRVEHNGADFWYRFLIDYMLISCSSYSFLMLNGLRQQYQFRKNLLPP